MTGGGVLEWVVLAIGAVASLLAAAREIGRREGVRQGIAEEQARIKAEAARQAAEAARKAAAAAEAYRAAGGALGAARKGEY